MSLSSAVTPGNDAFAGGTITRASNPTNVAGTYGAPGASAAPPNVPTPQILTARNNSGTNVRIPYARLVPLRPKQTGGTDAFNWAAVPDIHTRANGELNGRPLGQEYDGLETGELAWILGRRFINYPGADGTGNNNGAATFAAIGASAHQLGQGFGPDRMQRLAYTAWMEGFFRGTFGKMFIPLDTLSLTSPENQYMSSELRKYAPFLAGRSAVGSLDLPHFLNGKYSGKAPKRLQYHGAVDKTQPIDPARYDDAGNKVAGTGTNPVPVPAEGTDTDGLSSGIFTMEIGPFLRGKVIDDSAVHMIADDLKTTNRGANIFHSVPRKLGDDLAFEALFAQMRAMSFFDWSPDGMVLSKLESPSGEPLSSAELDARQAQLFNVAVQGPAIAKTWTGDPAMQVMPMDKVFVVMVADLHTKAGGDNSGKGAAVAAYDTWSSAGRPDDGYDTVQQAITDADQANAAAYKQNITLSKGANASGKSTSPDAYHAAVVELFDATAVAASSKTPAARERVLVARRVLAEYAVKFDYTVFETLADKVRRGAQSVTSNLCNFRLMRVTSSYLAQNSGVRMQFEKDAQGDPTATGTVDPKSRCGLRFGAAKGGGYLGEYIIGGWCIGTVMDSAASRSTVGHQVRIAPASMAINVSVNVEWWSGDKLYKHYMDAGNMVHRRGEYSKVDDPNNRTRTPQSGDLGLDVPLSDLEEALSFVSSD